MLLLSGQISPVQGEGNQHRRMESELFRLPKNMSWLEGKSRARIRSGENGAVQKSFAGMTGIPCKWFWEESGEVDFGALSDGLSPQWQGPRPDWHSQWAEPHWQRVGFSILAVQQQCSWQDSSSEAFCEQKQSVWGMADTIETTSRSLMKRCECMTISKQSLQGVVKDRFFSSIRSSLH